MGCNLWETRTQESNGIPAGQLRRLTNWPKGFVFGNISATAEGGRLAFIKHASQARTYLAEISAGGAHITPPRLLTLAEGWSEPVAWSPDGKAILLSSNRGGNYGIRNRRLRKKPRAREGLCVIAELFDRTEITFTAFDPLGGRGGEVGRFKLDSKATYAWDLSPDSTRIPMVDLLDSRIQIFAL